LRDTKFSLIVGNIFSKQLEEYVNAKRILENWRGAWVAQLVGRLPSAQIMIPGDRAPRRAPCSSGGLLLPLPLPLPLLCSLSLCQINRWNLGKKKKKKERKSALEIQQKL